MAEQTLANLRRLRGKIRATLKQAGIPNDYSKLRDLIKDSPELRKEIEELFGLAAGYAGKRMEIHHKVFLKGLEPYLFRQNADGILDLRPVEHIQRMVKGIEDAGWKIGDQKANLQILPKYMHVGSRREKLSNKKLRTIEQLGVHQILGKYFDFQGVADETEFTDIVTKVVDGKNIKYGHKKLSDGTIVRDAMGNPIQFQITDAKHGMSEAASQRIFKSNDIDALTKEMVGKLDFEGPQMKAAIAATAYLSPEVPDNTKIQLIQEYAGKGGAELDELFDIMRASERIGYQNQSEALKVLKGATKFHGVDPLDFGVEKQRRLLIAKQNLRRQEKLLAKLNNRSLQREFGISSPFSKRLKQKRLSAAQQNIQGNINQLKGNVNAFMSGPTLTTPEGVQFAGAIADTQTHAIARGLGHVAEAPRNLHLANEAARLDNVAALQDFTKAGTTVGRRVSALMPFIGAAGDVWDVTERYKTMMNDPNTGVSDWLDKAQFGIATATVGSTWWAEPVNTALGLTNVAIDIGRTLGEEDKRKEAARVLRSLGRVGINKIGNLTKELW